MVGHVMGHLSQAGMPDPGSAMTSDGQRVQES